MKTKLVIMWAVLITCLMFGMIACGGGGGSGSAAGTAVVSKGAITGFGSVFVNGVEFETTSTNVVSDDAGVAATDLKIGMTVKVKGKINDDGVTGSAEHIEYEDSLEGPAQNLTATGCTILGQRVTVNAKTVISGATDLPSIGAGQVVEVSGAANADGSITATRIEKKGASEAKIRGTVGNLDTAAKTFVLTVSPTLTYTVNFATAQLVPDAAALVNGAYVKVKSAAAPSGTTITATKVSTKKSGLDDSPKAEVQGQVAEFNATQKTFTVNGVKVDAAGITLPAGFADGMMIEVKGAVSGGVLTAVECKTENEIENEQHGADG